MTGSSNYKIYTKSLLKSGRYTKNDIPDFQAYLSNMEPVIAQLVNGDNDNDVTDELSDISDISSNSENSINAVTCNADWDKSSEEELTGHASKDAVSLSSEISHDSSTDTESCCIPTDTIYHESASSYHLLFNTRIYESTDVIEFGKKIGFDINTYGGFLTNLTLCIDIPVPNGFEYIDDIAINSIRQVVLTGQHEDNRSIISSVDRNYVAMHYRLLQDVGIDAMLKYVYTERKILYENQVIDIMRILLPLDMLCGMGVKNNTLKLDVHMSQLSELTTYSVNKEIPLLKVCVFGTIRYNMNTLVKPVVTYNITVKPNIGNPISHYDEYMVDLSKYPTVRDIYITLHSNDHIFEIEFLIDKQSIGVTGPCLLNYHNPFSRFKKISERVYYQEFNHGVTKQNLKMIVRTGHNTGNMNIAVNC